MCKEESSSGPYYRSQYMSRFTSIQEAALLKIPIAVKLCRTGSCEHPLTTASSAESCLKTCFLQATFTVCCHKALFLLSQQTNLGNFVLLDTGITVRRTRAKHSVGNIFFPFFGSNMARGKRRYSTMSAYLLWPPNYGVSNNGVFCINTSCCTIFPMKWHSRAEPSSHPTMAGKCRSKIPFLRRSKGKKTPKTKHRKGSDSFSFLVFFQLLKKSFYKLLRFDFNWSSTWDPKGKETSQQTSRSLQKPL